MTRRQVWNMRTMIAWFLTAAVAVGYAAPASAAFLSGKDEGKHSASRATSSDGVYVPNESPIPGGDVGGNDMADASPSDAETATPSQLLLLKSATGDLWNQWIGAEMEWDGEGSERNPYKITSLSELMGLSEAVARGETFSGEYFELQTDVDLGNLELNSGCWNPIGWYRNRTELGGTPPAAFEGTFDGAGNTISGLRFTKTDYDYSYLGLFGYVKDATVKNLVLDGDEVSGEDRVGLLVGCVEGNSRIYNVSVGGSVYARGDAGGIAGEVTGGSRRAVIENCTAEQTVINSEGTGSFVGGIAGNVQKADLVDVSVMTLDGDSNRIQGKGYVGGIAGRQNQTNIYNSYVAGTIGGNRTKAAGGITGLYESGCLVVARMDGDIGRTNNGAASREGTIIGTRESGNGFRYGTGRNDHLSYLYAGDAAQTKKLIGSGFSDDNVWTMDAHIGYFTDYEKKYTQVAGTTEKGCGERYFYEELEDGIKYIITQKLGGQLTAGGEDDWQFRPDHFAPGNQGEPVLGYLVSVPRIDTKNANGTFDNDVAVLTAISSTNNSYYRQIDKDSPSAVAPGCTVTVSTAAKNQNGNRYQMVYDADEPGRVKPPTYTDEEGDRQPMTYVHGGSYSFEMPENDTELNAEYVKVTTQLSMTPEETEISVVQTRTGDRKQPEILTEVRDNQGTLIARYINGRQDASVQALPVAVHAEHNGEGSSADRTVLWSIDDVDLLHFAEGWSGGYTEKDAKIVPNMDSSFIQEILQREVKAQADGNYQQAIKNTIYRDSAVVTASTNPSTSVDHEAVTGTCKVNVTFQILDQTTVRVEQLVLNQNHITFEIVRRLTGDRRNPKETYLVTEPISLDASLNPSQPFYKNVSWADAEAGKIIRLTPSGANEQSCLVEAVYDGNGKQNPSWLQNIINADNSAYMADGGYLRRNGSGSITETVTATSEDQTHGIVRSDCTVTIQFRTDDQTVIHPEGIELNKTELLYDVSYTFTGDTNSEIQSKHGFGQRDTLKAAVLPELSEEPLHQPYNRAVKWESSDPDALSVNDGVLTVNEQAAWIRDARKQAPYKAVKQVDVTAQTEDGALQKVCHVTLVFHANALEADRETETFDLVLTKTGKRSNPTLTWSGGEPKTIGAALYADREDLTVRWESSDSSILTVSEDGAVTPVTTDGEGAVISGWIKQAMEVYPYEAEARAMITVSSSDGRMADTIPVTLTFKLVDNTYSGGGSGGSGGSGSGSSGGGGGSSSSGVTPGGSTSSFVMGGPAGSVTGTWIQDAAGKWLFTGQGRTYANEWAYIHNPYAAAGQNKTDWFLFDESGYMATGWYTDPQGATFYLWPSPDGSLGHMLTGWQWIVGADGLYRCYYFQETSDGNRGILWKHTTTPDGYTVDEQGRWILEGVVQTRVSAPLSEMP